MRKLTVTVPAAAASANGFIVTLGSCNRPQSTVARTRRHLNRPITQVSQPTAARQVQLALHLYRQGSVWLSSAAGGSCPKKLQAAA